MKVIMILLLKSGYQMRKRVMQSLNSISENRTLILIAHRISTLESCNRIIRLEHGKIDFDGNFSEFYATHNEQNDYLN